LSRYFSKIVLGLLIAAPLVLVPSFSANAADATAPMSAPTPPNVPTPGHVPPPANPVTPQKPPTMKDPRNDVLPPGVVPLGPGEYRLAPVVDGAPTPYDLLDVRVNALSTSLKWMAVGNFVLLVMVISLLVRGRKTRQRSEPDPQPTYKLN